MGFASQRKGGGGHGGGGGGHDGSGGLRWLLTYADTITLLLALFIYLYSVSEVSHAKLEAFSVTFAEMFGIGNIPIPNDSGGAGSGPVNLPGTSSQDGSEEGGGDQKRQVRRLSQPLTMEELRKMRARLEESLPEFLARKRLSFEETDEGLIIRLRSNTIFEAGSATVSPQAVEVLEEIAQEIGPIVNDIRVEGHTDNLPVTRGQFRSNWELSAARAAAVVRYFLGTVAIPPAQLSISGYAEFRPIAPNYDGVGNPLNRRVEILILKPSMRHDTPDFTRDVVLPNSDGHVLDEEEQETVSPNPERTTDELESLSLRRFDLEGAHAQ